MAEEQSRGPAAGVQAQDLATGVPTWGPAAGVQARDLAAVVQSRALTVVGQARGPATGVLGQPQQ